MAIKIGNDEISGIQFGENVVGHVYKGDSQMWPNYVPFYGWFEYMGYGVVTTPYRVRLRDYDVILEDYLDGVENFSDVNNIIQLSYLEEGEIYIVDTYYNSTSVILKTPEIETDLRYVIGTYSNVISVDMLPWEAGYITAFSDTMFINTPLNLDSLKLLTRNIVERPDGWTSDGTSFIADKGTLNSVSNFSNSRGTYLSLINATSITNSFVGADKTHIINFDKIQNADLSGSFQNLPQLLFVDGIIDTTNCTNRENIFENCPNLLHPTPDEVATLREGGVYTPPSNKMISVGYKRGDLDHGVKFPVGEVYYLDGYRHVGDGTWKNIGESGTLSFFESAIESDDFGVYADSVYSIYTTSVCFTDKLIPEPYDLNPLGKITVQIYAQAAASIKTLSFLKEIGDNSEGSYIDLGGARPINMDYFVRNTAYMSDGEHEIYNLDMSETTNCYETFHSGNNTARLYIYGIIDTTRCSWEDKQSLFGGSIPLNFTQDDVAALKSESGAVIVKKHPPRRP